jgi:hypothetical protein
MNINIFFVNVENLKLVHPTTFSAIAIAEKVVGCLSSIFHHFGLQKKYKRKSAKFFEDLSHQIPKNTIVLLQSVLVNILIILKCSLHPGMELPIYKHYLKIYFRLCFSKNQTN